MLAEPRRENKWENNLSTPGRPPHPPRRHTSCQTQSPLCRGRRPPPQQVWGGEQPQRRMSPTWSPAAELRDPLGWSPPQGSWDSRFGSHPGGPPKYLPLLLKEVRGLNWEASRFVGLRQQRGFALVGMLIIRTAPIFLFFYFLQI